MDIAPLRRKQLEEGIAEDLSLLKAYEDQERLSSDPKERARCKLEIKRLQAAIQEKQLQLRSLQETRQPLLSNTSLRSAGRWSIGNIDNLSTLITSDEGPDPIWLLGAGASWKSGIPLTRELVERAVKWAYCRAHHRSLEDNTVLRSDWLPWLYNHSWFNQSLLLEAQYSSTISQLLLPVEFRREFFRYHSKANASPSDGYHRILDFMATKRLRTVITTNFDSILPDLSVTVPNPRHVTVIRSPYEHNEISTAPIYPQVIYLHGAMDAYATIYFARSNDRLEVGLIDSLIPLLRDHPLIIVGYRGSESSVMNSLFLENMSRVKQFPNGIYWCTLESEQQAYAEPLVSQLADLAGNNFCFVPIKGFDDLLSELWNMNKAKPVSTVAPTYELVTTKPPTFDLQPMSHLTLSELDWSLLHPRIVSYCQEMNIAIPSPVTQEWLIGQMLSLGLAIDNKGILCPTVAGVLLFSNNLLDHSPAARIEVFIEGEEPRSFTGNLFQQLKVVEYLESEFNLPFRLKGSTSETVQPYPPLALKELIVNALAHRRYDVNSDQAVMIYIEEDFIRITNPGGLHEEARRQLPPETPVEKVLGTQPIKGYRNPVVADFFYGSGEMDKLGSGLTDVHKWTRQNGGDVSFLLGADDTFFEVTIFRRPEKPDEKTGAASPQSFRAKFRSNIVEVLDLPKTLWFSNTNYRWAPQILRELGNIKPPSFILYDSRLYTFSDLSIIENPLQRFINTKEIFSISTSDFLKGESGERRLVHLLNETLRTYLEKKGLIFDWNRKRVYFPRTDEGERQITYQARLRQATRTVVKARISSVTNQVIYWEHQALSFQFKQFGQVWGLQLLPTYVFTYDGFYARLPGERSGPMATKRLSREYNVHVDNHLVFWTTLFADGNQYILLEDSFGSRVLLSNTVADSKLIKQEAQTEEDDNIITEEDLDEMETQFDELSDERPDEDEHNN